MFQWVCSIIPHVSFILIIYYIVHISTCYIQCIEINITIMGNYFHSFPRHSAHVSIRSMLSTFILQCSGISDVIPIIAEQRTSVLSG